MFSEELWKVFFKLSYTFGKVRASKKQNNKSDLSKLSDSWEMADNLGDSWDSGAPIQTLYNKCRAIGLSPVFKEQV